MKRKFYSWEECMNLREVKVRMVMIQYEQVIGQVTAAGPAVTVA